MDAYGGMPDGKINCIIVGAGDFNGLVSMPDPQRDLVIAADGGYAYLKELGIVPDIWVGDADSLEEKNAGKSNEHAEILSPENEVAEMIRLPREKDDTDTLAAVRIGMERGCRSFMIYGGCGGRIDHTIANIKVLSFIEDMGCVGYMYDRAAMLTVIRNRGVSFPPQAAGMVSVFSLSDESRGVDISGLKYEVRDMVLMESDSIGVSNEFVGRPGSIAVRDGKLLIVVG